MVFPRRTVLVVLCTVVLMAMMAVNSYAQLKIGYIRPQYIFQQYEPYLEAQKQIEEFQTAEQGKLDNDYQVFQQSVQDYQKQALVMSEEMQQQREQELLKQQQALEERYDELTRVDGLLDQKQQELIAPIIDNINDILMRIGDSEDYDFIFDASVGGLIFADEQYDISDQVLVELQQELSSP